MKTRQKLVVVITGASSGIGQATAEAFAREGADLVLAARDLDAVQSVARRCRALGGRALASAVDVTLAEQTASLAGEAVGFAGRIDVWVSNVGTGAVGAFHETPAEVHEQVVKANLIGHMNDARAVLPVFIRQGRGVFVNMISLGGFAAAPFAAAYSASKYGLRGFSEALRGELAPYPGIHICDVYPAFVDAPGIVHAANFSGRRLSAPPPLLDPRTVAAEIVRLARRPKPTSMVGAVTGLVRIAHFLSPELSARAMAAFMRAYFRRAKSAAATTGNLFRPPDAPGGIDGGLRSASGSRASPIAKALLGAAGAALLLYAGRRRRRRSRLSEWRP